MAPSSNISLRIITSEQQITEALQFRYNIYKKDFPLCVEGLSEPFESDLYDRRSIHLGIFDDDTKKLIGYCRMILPPAFRGQFSQWMVEEHPKFLLRDNGFCNPRRLAFMNYILSGKVRKKITSFCVSLEKKQTVYVEISRLMIAEEYRSLAMSTFFASGINAVCNAVNIACTIFICDPHHESFYRKFGLNFFTEVDVSSCIAYGKRKIVYGIELNSSSEFKSTNAALRIQFEHEQQITFKKKYPQAA